MASHRDRSPARRRGSEPARAVAAGLFLASGLGWALGVSADWVNPETVMAAEQTVSETPPAQTPEASAEAKAKEAGSAQATTQAPASAASAPKTASTPAKTQAASAEPAKTQAAGAPPAPASKGPAAKPQATAATASRTTRVVSVASTGKGARTASTSGATTTQTLAPQDERVTYQYNALGRRDPFRPLVGGGLVTVDQSNAPPDVGGMRVVGIVWGADDKFALVEDPRGSSLVLRKGDKVMNGIVETLRRDAVVVKLSIDGQTQSVAIPLSRKGDQANASE